MIAAERLRCITERLLEKTIVTVSDLSKEMGVTEETIRRDLEKLEKQEVIWKVHGGARLRTPLMGREVPVSIRQEMSTEEKIAVARKCLEYIRHNDVLMLDNSTTVLCLARELKATEMKLTVITNSLAILNELSAAPNIEIISPGGALNAETNGFSSGFAIEAIDKFHAGKCFISSSGISAKFGLTDHYESEALIRRKMLLNSDKRYFISDLSKIEKKMVYVVGGIDMLDCVIIDKPAPAQFVDHLRQSKVSFVSCK